MEEFELANLKETLAGNIVLTIGCNLHNDIHASIANEIENAKVKLDALHKDKIKMADEILVLDVNGYIGDSTRSEIEFAKNLNKKIRYLGHT